MRVCLCVGKKGRGGEGSLLKPALPFIDRAAVSEHIALAGTRHTPAEEQVRNTIKSPALKTPQEAPI